MYCIHNYVTIRNKLWHLHHFTKYASFSTRVYICVYLKHMYKFVFVKILAAVVKLSQIFYYFSVFATNVPHFDASYFAILDYYELLIHRRQ